MNKFSVRLKELLKESAVSKRDLAKRLNVSVRAVYYWESGKRECDFDTLLEICGIFDVSADFLLGKTDY